MERHRSVNNLDCWLPAARAGLVAMTPLMNKQFSGAIRQPLLNQNDRRIIINVSGRKFETWEKTLQKYPQTLLGSLDLDSFYDKEKKEYFFDRDPIFFRHVLNFYRKGKLHFSLDECGISYKDELKFFRISQDRMELCCFEEMDEASRRGVPKEPEKTGVAKCQCKPAKRSPKELIWDLFENPHSTLLGKTINITVGIAIVVSIMTTVVETVPCGNNLTCGQTYKRTFFNIDATCVFIFTLEYLVRLFVAPEKMKFIKNFHNIIDVASILPFYLRLFLQSSGGKSEQLVVLRVLRVLRVVKMARHSKRLRTLGGSIKNSSSELGFILFSFSLGVIIFATVIYYCEKDEPKTTFLSIPDSMWYAIVTMTTLGYGDMTPETTMGQLMGSICCVVGTLVIALPVPILEMKMKLIGQNNNPEDEDEDGEGPDNEHVCNSA
ncbi:potassium voltage-gated channel protein Shal-like [Actinia tenebrosa]|uniref:Potassium voltage-gated channel protein Shal-like n=1 Tax=Actinia tenebrosa TaxID=6105 RepID=A0A6P8JD01_ACTTE|nr:potassium voltage-gated channel protein Shal-like [Actinia tenebrosa]